ncbi:MAG TPA: M56 family metallopeptidase, partial [Phycisphaerae bacterium]|nr:M56 family metallopeptidase [Phycisphaerae bacterium]
MDLAQLLRGIAGSPNVCRLGWALVHSLWIAAAVAGVLSVVLALLRRRSPNARYLAGCAALAATVALVAGALFLVPPRTHSGNDRAVSARYLPQNVPLTSGTVPARGRQTAPVEAGEGVPPFPKALPAPIPAATDAPAGESFRAPWPARISRAIEPALPWLVAAWATGVCVLIIWHLGGWVAVGRLTRQASPSAGADLVAAAVRLSRALRIRRPVRLLESAAVCVPTVAGWLRPVVLLPASLATGLSPGQVEAVLAHELAHIRRWDYLANLLQSLVETLLFYHPAVWWMSRRIRAEREHCCDDVAVEACGDRWGYAGALAALAERVVVSRAAVTAGGGCLTDRVRRLLTPRAGHAGGARTYAVGAALVAGLLILGVCWVVVAAAGRPPTGPAADPMAPTAATLGKWLEGKEVVEVCFAGAHMEPLKLRDSLKLKVADNDWDFRLTPGEGGGANRS